MATYISHKQRVFDPGLNPRPLRLIRRRSECRLKAYGSCTDSRAWSLDHGERSLHLRDIVRSTVARCSGELIPISVILDAFLSPLQRRINALRDAINLIKPGEADNVLNEIAQLEKEEAKRNLGNLITQSGDARSARGFSEVPCLDAICPINVEDTEDVCSICDEESAMAGGKKGKKQHGKDDETEEIEGKIQGQGNKDNEAGTSHGQDSQQKYDSKENLIPGQENQGEFYDEFGNKIPRGQENQGEFYDEFGNKIPPGQENQGEFYDAIENKILPGQENQEELYDSYGNKILPGQENQGELDDSFGNKISPENDQFDGKTCWDPVSCELIKQNRRQPKTEIKDMKKEEIIYIPSHDDIHETEGVFETTTDEYDTEEANNDIELDHSGNQLTEVVISIHEPTNFGQKLDNIKELPTRIPKKEICDPECSRLRGIYDETSDQELCLNIIEAENADLLYSREGQDSSSSSSGTSANLSLGSECICETPIEFTPEYLSQQLQICLNEKQNLENELIDFEEQFVKLEKDHLELQVLYQDENANTEALMHVIELKEQELKKLRHTTTLQRNQIDAHDQVIRELSDELEESKIQVENLINEINDNEQSYSEVLQREKEESNYQVQCENLKCQINRLQRYEGAYDKVNYQNSILRERIQKINCEMTTKCLTLEKEILRLQGRDKEALLLQHQLNEYDAIAKEQEEEIKLLVSRIAQITEANDNNESRLCKLQSSMKNTEYELEETSQLVIMLKVLVGEAERDFREEKCRCDTLKRELDAERNVIEQVSSLLIYSNNEFDGEARGNVPSGRKCVCNNCGFVHTRNEQNDKFTLGQIGQVLSKYTSSNDGTDTCPCNYKISDKERIKKIQEKLNERSGKVICPSKESSKKKQKKSSYSESHDSFLSCGCHKNANETLLACGCHKTHQSKKKTSKNFKINKACQICSIYSGEYNDPKSYEVSEDVMVSSLQMENAELRELLIRMQDMTCECLPRGKQEQATCTCNNEIPAESSLQSDNLSTLQSEINNLREQLKQLQDAPCDCVLKPKGDDGLAERLKKANSRIKELEDELNSLKKRLGGDEICQRDLKEAKKRINDLEQELEKLRKERDQLNAKLKELENQVQKLSGDKTQIGDLEAELAKLRKENELLNNKIKGLENDLQKAILDRDNFEKLYKSEKDKNTGLENERDLLKKKLEDMGSDLQDQLNKYKAMIDSLNKEKDNLNQKLQDQLARVKSLEDDLNNQKALNERLKQEKDNLSKELADANSKNMALEEDLKKERALTNALKAEKDGLVKQLAQADSRMKALESELENQKNLIGALQKEKDNLNKQLADEKAKVASLQDDLNNQKALIETLQNEKDRLNEELAKEKQKSEALQQNLNQQKALIDSLQKEKDALNRELAEEKSKSSALQEQLNKEKALNDTLQKERDALNHQLAEEKSKVAALQDQVNKQNAIINGLQSEKDSLEKQLENEKNKAADLLNELNKQKGLLDALEKEKQGLLSQLENERKKVAELQEDLNNQKELINSLQKEKDALSKQLENEKNKLAAVQDELNKQKELNDQLFKEKNALLKELGDEKSKNAALEKEKDLLSKRLAEESAKANALQEEINKQKELIDSLQKEKDTLNQKLAEEKAKVQALQKDLNEKDALLNTLKNELDQEKAKTSALQSELNNQKELMDSLKKQFEDEKLKNNALQNELNKQNDLINSLQKEKDDLNKQLSEEKAKSNALQNDLNNQKALIDSLQKEKDALNKQLDEEKSKLDNLENQIKGLQAEKDALNNQLDEAKNKINEMEKNCEDQIKKMAGDYENQLQKMKEDQGQRQQDQIQNIKSESLDKIRSIEDDCEEKLKKLREMLEADMDKLKANYEAQMKSLKDQHQGEMDKLKKNFDDQLNAIKSENASLKDTLNKERADGQRKMEDQKSILEDEHLEDLKRLKNVYKSESDELRSQHMERVASLQSAHAQEIEELSKDYQIDEEIKNEFMDDRIKELEKKSIEAIDHLSKRHSEERQHIKGESQLALKTIKSDCEQELEALKKYYEDLLAKAKSDCKKELENLQKHYEDLLAKGDGDSIEKRITSSELETYEIKPETDEIAADKSLNPEELIRICKKILNEGLKSLNFCELAYLHQQVCSATNDLQNSCVPKIIQQPHEPINPCRCNINWSNVIVKNSQLQHQIEICQDIYSSQIDQLESNVETLRKHQMKIRKNIDYNNESGHAKSHEQISLKIERNIGAQNSLYHERRMRELISLLEKEKFKNQTLEEELIRERTRSSNLQKLIKEDPNPKYNCYCPSKESPTPLFKREKFIAECGARCSCGKI